LILSLVKPLVARPGRVAEPHRLDPEQQPLLFSQDGATIRFAVDAGYAARR